MSASKISLTLEAALCCVLLLPAASSQTSPQLGKLVIKSTPQGATITINGQTMNQQTDATFVVSPGNYKVSVTGGVGNLNCPVPEKDVQVPPSSQATVLCLVTGWASAPK